MLRSLCPLCADRLVSAFPLIKCSVPHSSSMPVCFYVCLCVSMWVCRFLCSSRTQWSFLTYWYGTPAGNDASACDDVVKSDYLGECLSFSRYWMVEWLQSVYPWHWCYMYLLLSVKKPTCLFLCTASWNQELLWNTAVKLSFWECCHAFSL